MKEIKTKISLSIMASPVGCPRKQEVLDIIDNASGSGLIPLKVIIGEKRNARVDMCIDEVAAENVFGQVKTATRDDGSSLSADEVAALANEDYDIKLTGRTGNTISAEMAVYVGVVGENVSLPKKDLMAKVRQEADAAAKRTGYTDNDERIAYMVSCKVHPTLMLRVFRQMRKYKKGIKRPSALYRDPYPETKDETIVAQGIRAACDKHPLVMQGDKSVGKNIFCDTIAWVMGMPIRLITWGPYMSASDINGDKKTDSSAAQAVAAFDPEILAKAGAVREKRKPYYKFLADLNLKGVKIDPAVQAALDAAFTPDDDAILEKAAEFDKLAAAAATTQVVMDESELYEWLIDGGVMVFNEMNLADAGFFASYANQLCDETGYIALPGRGEVAINPDCVLFGTQNADYQGVQLQNEASVTRFGTLLFAQPETIIDQLKASVRGKLMKNGYNPDALSERYYKAAQNFYAVLMKAVKNQNSTADISGACLNIRGFVKALVAVGQSEGVSSLGKQLEIYVVNPCPTAEHPALMALLYNTVNF